MKPFEEYLTKEAVQRGLKTNDLIQVDINVVLHTVLVTACDCGCDIVCMD